MEINELKFRYKDAHISSVSVSFDSEPEDAVLISGDYLKELSRYLEVTEDDIEIFYILARAIQLKKENSRKIEDSKKYELCSEHEDFIQIFTFKLVEMAKYVHLSIVADYFDYDAKLEDLYIFCVKPVSELITAFNTGLPLTTEMF